MSAKTLISLVCCIFLAVGSVVGIALWVRMDDRPSHQEGFRQLMDKKVHGRDLFDGFTSDPTPARKGK